jgi:hypothetical protein
MHLLQGTPHKIVMPRVTGLREGRVAPFVRCVWVPHSNPVAAANKLLFRKEPFPLRRLLQTRSFGRYQPCATRAYRERLARSIDMRHSKMLGSRAT